MMTGRLKELAELQDGWYDGDPGSKAPRREVIGAAREFAESLASPPRMYPMADGGISIEWSTPGHEFGVAIDPWGGTDKATVVPTSRFAELEKLAADAISELANVRSMYETATWDHPDDECRRFVLDHSEAVILRGRKGLGWADAEQNASGEVEKVEANGNA